MASGSSPPQLWSRLLSQAVRAIRRRSGLRAAEVAQRMNMPLRSYEYFEAGGGRVSLERLHDFAEATESDPMAILAAIFMGSPEFAVRSSRNKMMLALMLALREFDADAGDAIELVETGTYLTHFSQMFSQLAAEAVERRKLAQDIVRRGRITDLNMTDLEESAELAALRKRWAETRK